MKKSLLSNKIMKGLAGGVLIALLIVAIAFTQRHEAVTSYHVSEWNILAEDLDRVVNSSGYSFPIALKEVKGGIVSHHIPQTFPELASFYLRLREHQQVKRFIILGPDHINAGKSAVTVSNEAFVTSFGEVKPITDCAEYLHDEGVAFIEEKPFDLEHSIGSQVFLVSKIFPHAEVTPIIFRSDTTSAQAHAVAEALIRCIDRHTVVIASVDFSHYLSESQARPIDQLSGEVVKNLDRDSLDLINADSGKSLETFIEVLTYMKATSTADIRVLNTNDVMQNNDYTTGYVFGYWGVQ